MLIKNFLLILISFVGISSCALMPPERNINRDKPKSHIKRLKECIDSFMTEQGVGIEEAFDVCEKIHRR